MSEKMKPTKKQMLDEICSLLYYQCSLADQDRWLQMMIDRGWWKTPSEEEPHRGGQK